MELLIDPPRLQPAPTPVTLHLASGSWHLHVKDAKGKTIDTVEVEGPQNVTIEAENAG